MQKRVVAFDTETSLILRGLNQPPIACLSWATRDAFGNLQKGILTPKEGITALNNWLDDENVILVGNHTQFDTAGMANVDGSLLEPLFRKYERCLVTDTLLRERLIDLANGKLRLRKQGYFSMQNLVKKHFAFDLDKTKWRTGYGSLIGVPLCDWQEGAKQYAIDDAVWTLLLYEKQIVRGFNSEDGLTNDAEQASVGFALQLMSTWGMRTNEKAVDKLEARLQQAYDIYLDELMNTKDVRGRAILKSNGVQDMAFVKELVLASYKNGSESAPLTDKGNVSTSAETLEECSHPFLQNLTEYKKIGKILKTFVPVVRQGTKGPICTRFTTLLKNGRSSSSNPNLQNLPRGGGVRECFTAREGMLFVNADYDTLEVRTFAQVLFDMGFGDTLLKAYQADPNFDPHSRLAAQMLGITYAEGIALKDAGDKAFKNARQRSKAASFGYPGGMGANTFIDYAKDYGLTLSLADAKELKKFWQKSVPESRKYFAWVSKKCGDSYGTAVQLRSGRIRGACHYTELANTMWSGLAADGVKHATFNIAKACYTQKDSPLYGSRPVAVIHDEFILETPEHKAPEAGLELSRIMQSSMEVFTPNIPSRAPATLMKRWYKDAEPCFDAQGRLTEWKPN